MNLTLIGSRIKELRIKSGLTQSELANVLSVSFQAVSSWERGIAPPDIENLMKIAKHFGVLIDTLLSPVSQDLYLGIDGGGTKTEFIVLTSSGEVLARVLRSGTNPNDIGLTKTEEILSSGIDELLVKYPTVKSIFAGISGVTVGGYKEKLKSALKKLYPKIKIQVIGDIFNLFALRDEVNMAVISGTGSVVFCKSEDGYRRIGGWGHLFDFAGSAYDIGRAAVRIALAEEDFGKGKSYIRELLIKKFNTTTVWEKIDELYSGGKSSVASLAPLVFLAYAAGDDTAIQIIDENAKALAELLNTGKERYCGGNYAIASGGVFLNNFEIMKKHISKYTTVSILKSTLPPIFGAAKNACRLAGDEMQADFYENFKKSYGDKK